MKKGYYGTKEAIEITKILLQSCEIKGTPTSDTANDIADFIQTLSTRLEPICGQTQE